METSATVLRRRHDTTMSRVMRCILLVVVTQSIGCSHEEAANPRNAELDHGTAKIRYPATDRSHEEIAGLKRPSIRAESVPSVQQAARQPDTLYLATESRFIEHGGLSRTRADEILESREGFSRALEEMSSDAARNTDAQDLADHYRSALVGAVGSDGAVASFSCGLSMCMGSVQTRMDVDNGQWNLRFLDAASTRVFGHVSTLEKIGDLQESRFIFSTDPNVPGIVVPIND